MKLAVHNYAEILAFAVGVVSLPRLRFPVLQWLVAFLGLTLLVELAGFYLPTSFIIKHAAKYYNGFIGVQISFFLLCLLIATQKRQNKEAIKAMLVAFAMIFVINLVGIQGVSTFNHITYLAGALFLIVASCLFFFELLSAESTEGLFRNNLFWLVAAILFFFTSTFVYFLFWFYLVIKELDKGGQLFQILMQVINVVFYSLIIISFLCQMKERKSY